MQLRKAFSISLAAEIDLLFSSCAFLNQIMSQLK